MADDWHIYRKKNKGKKLGPAQMSRLYRAEKATFTKPKQEYIPAAVPSKLKIVKSTAVPKQVVTTELEQPGRAGSYYTREAYEALQAKYDRQVEISRKLSEQLRDAENRIKAAREEERAKIAGKTQALSDSLAETIRRNRERVAERAARKT